MISAIVTDIEGTTSSISFVKDVLFPYARQHIGAFVERHQDDDQIKILLQDVSKEVGKNLDTPHIINQLLKWIDEDKKITPLKVLQGLLWEEGYFQGAFKGHIYPDVVENLRVWHDDDIALYVYSSGSVYAQKLLFRHTEYGDLTPLFSGYFDTHIGAKQDTASYRHIKDRLNCSPEQILFLSDIKGELDAAQAAGLQTVWLNRDNAADTDIGHRQAVDFNAVSGYIPLF